MEDLPAGLASELIDSLSYIRLETSSECIIGYANRFKVLPTPAGLVIYGRFSQQAPMLFSETGEFIGRIGSIGKGPGEFVQPDHVAFDHKNQQFLITGHRSVHFYSAERAYIRSFTLETEDKAISRLVMMPNNKIAALYHVYTQNPLGKVGVLILDSQGQIQEDYDMTDPSRLGSYSGFWTMNTLYMNGKDLLFSVGPNREIWRLTRNKEWVLEAQLNYYFPPMPKNLLGLRPSDERGNEYMRNYPMAQTAVISGDYINVHYSSPMMQWFYVNRKTGKIFHCPYNGDFKAPGLKNDLDGGRPNQINDFNSDRSYELMDMIHVFRDIENQVIDSTGTDPEQYQAFQQLLQELDPSDNPVVRVSHLR